MTKSTSRGGAGTLSAGSSSSAGREGGGEGVYDVVTVTFFVLEFKERTLCGAVGASEDEDEERDIDVEEDRVGNAPAAARAWSIAR